MTTTTSPEKTDRAPSTSSALTDPVGRTARGSDLLGATSTQRSSGNGRGWHARPAMDRRRLRIVAVIVGVVLVLALAVPLGLARLSGGASSNGDAVAPAAPQLQGSSGSDTPERATGTDGSAGSSGSRAAPDALAGTGAKSGSATTSAPGAATVLDAKIARSAWLGLQ